MKKSLLIVISFVYVSVSGLMAQDVAKEYSTLFNEGVKKSGEQKFDEAIGLFSDALKLKPDYSEALFARGQCYLLSNERNKACLDFEQCKKLGLKQSEDYIAKYCGKDSPGRTMKPSAIIQPK
jgi:tetratricopeptide (TPR) repeat protein